MQLPSRGTRAESAVSPYGGGFECFALSANAVSIRVGGQATMRSRRGLRPLERWAASGVSQLAEGPIGRGRRSSRLNRHCLEYTETKPAVFSVKVFPLTLPV